MLLDDKEFQEEVRLEWRELKFIFGMMILFHVDIGTNHE
jgi:hypothetical protein